MYMLIYDYDNNCVQDAAVYVDDKFIGNSDIHGRFMITLPSSRVYKMTLKKDGYEVIETKFSFKPSEALYFKMGNSNQFLKLSEDSLDNEKYDDALYFADKSLELNSGRIDALYLKAIIYNRLSDFEQSNKILSLIKQSEENTEYIKQLQIKNKKGGE